MNKWILSQISNGSPYGMRFDGEAGAGGDPAPVDPPADPPVVDPPPAAPPSDPPAWNFAEGVAGEGDAPEWFKGDKYNTVADQAKAYKELEGKFGAFTGAPDEYEAKVSAELLEKGVELDLEDPMISQAMEFAKAAGMNQEGFEGMLNLYSMGKLAEQGAWEEHKADELKALGQDAEARIDRLNKWANANLSEEQVSGLQEMTQSAAAVKTMEHIISMTGAKPMTPGDPAPGSVTETELNEMQFRKDDHGNRLIHTDKAFAAEFRKKSDQFHGTHDHVQVIGK